MSDRVTLSELARRLNHNKGYVHRLKTRGVLSFDDHGLIDEAQARSAIEAARERLLAPSTNSRFMAARTSRETYVAKLSKLDYEERVARLIDAKAARDAQLELAGLVRSRLLTIPDRVCALIAAETDVAKIRAVLSLEIRLALTTALADPEEGAK